MSKFTPGPWSQTISYGGGGSGNSIYNSFGDVVAMYQAPEFTHDKVDILTRISTSKKYDEVYAEQQANARLIIAAPEMYELLRDIATEHSGVLRHIRAADKLVVRIDGDE